MQSCHRAGGERVDGAVQNAATLGWRRTCAHPRDDENEYLSSQPQAFAVPNFVAVLESLLLGSIRADGELSAEAECGAYRAILGELARRIDTFQACSA